MHFFRDLGLWLLYIIFRSVITLRYRLHIKGLREIQNTHKQGILFLPNHPAEIDPILLVVLLWPKYRPRPPAIEQFYYQKGLRFFMDLVSALPLPNMNMVNQWKLRQIEKLKKKVIEGLKKGENFLIYPSGKLKLTAEEKIGGTFFIPELVSDYPEVNIVLIRTTGLWGSIFSKALSKETPDFGNVLLKGCKILLKNGIFFAPRRDVTIELTFAPKDFPRSSSKKELNRYLENWYNANLEPLKLVSYSFWKEQLPEVYVKKIEPVKITLPEAEQNEILEYIAKSSHFPKEKILSHFHLSNDLGLDSLDISQLYIYLEERFALSRLPPGQIQTVYDLFDAASGLIKEDLQEVSQKQFQWPKEKNRLAPDIPMGETIQEVFLHTCDRMKSSIACMDALVGAISYRKLKRAVIILALEIQKRPSSHVGILLPSSVGAYIVILACLFANKIPVMLNWTAGSRSLDHAATLCRLNVVLSSYRFLSRLDDGDLGYVDNLIEFLEDLRRKISLFLKLKGFLLSFRSAKTIMKKMRIIAKPDSHAVVIFTSGTETLPKGVPLTHKNILSNQRAALSCVAVENQDILYGVLPPFHSFGFSVTGIFPLLAGVKVCFAPDPTNSSSLAHDIEFWKPTLFSCAPSFIQSLLHVAKERQLQSLRLVVTGAEKTPKDLKKALEKYGIQSREGYGISECSPIITLEREKGANVGVGHPLPNTELCVIDPEKNILLSQGQEGEICICGPGVFQGYLGKRLYPFIDLQMKHWYRSGDRGYLEKDGNLVITGRLKRFMKVGAEMISLGGLEEDLQNIFQKNHWVDPQKQGPFLATIASDFLGEKSQIILFTIVEVDKDAINNSLKETGFGRLVKIAEVRRIKEIPLTGTGKTHYRLLEEMIENRS